MFRSILVVCVGNICRSPTAELLLRQRLEGNDVQIGSAGLAALAGKPIDPQALDVLVSHGLDGSAHRSRQIDDGLIRHADLILAMEQAHVDAITRRAPHVRGRTFLLGKWQNDRPIPDPYRQQRAAFEHVYRLIDGAVADWIPHLSP
jgi:protein-tyrosine phosphatase